MAINMDLYNKTPIIVSSALSEWLQKPVYLKLEMLQPSGSFKNRGLGFLCSKEQEGGAKKFISASGGNAGLAVAYSGRKLGIPVTVIIPKSTPTFMKAKIERERAQVIVYGNDLDEAIDFAKKRAQETESVFIHPYNHPLIWQGHQSIISEIVEFGKKPDLIILSVGGGGLLIGVLQGLHEVGWQNIPVMAVGTTGASALATSIKEDRVVTLPKIQTIATSLGLKQVAQEAFLWTKKHKVIPYVATDKEAVLASLKFLDDEQFLLEPACSASLVPLYKKDPELSSYNTILVIVCGGKVINYPLLEKWKNEFEITYP